LFVNSSKLWKKCWKKKKGKVFLIPFLILKDTEGEEEDKRDFPRKTLLCGIEYGESEERHYPPLLSEENVLVRGSP